MWPLLNDMHDHFQHKEDEALLVMQTKSEPILFDYAEEADYSIGLPLFDASSESPLGSELSSLPPCHPTLFSLDMTFIDANDNATWVSQPPSSRLDSALEDYTQTWRKLVHESSLLASSLFSHDQPRSAFTFEADPTPPLAFDFDVPATNTPDITEGQSSSTPGVEVVAPKPIRLTNPAIHLAALVEESRSQDAILDSVVQEYGYSKEQLREYMSDSDESSDESEDEDEDEDEEEDVISSNLNDFQFTYPHYHNIPEYGNSSPMSAVLPPATPLSATSLSTPILSRASQLRDTVRERRSARHGHGQGHSRHSSVPDVHYRPTKWSEAVRPEMLMPFRVRRRRREHVSHSVDWSSSAPENMYSVGPVVGMPYAYSLAREEYQ